MAVATQIWMLGGPSAELNELQDVITYYRGEYVGLGTILQSYDGDLEDQIREAFLG